MRGSATITVNQPIETVFAFVSNIDNMPAWVDGVHEPRMISEGALQVGSTFTSKYTYGGGTYTINYVVTDFDPPNRFGTASTEGPFPFKGLIELEAQDGKTRLTNIIDAGADNWVTSVMFTVFKPFIRRMMSRQLLKELELLRASLEASR